MILRARASHETDLSSKLRSGCGAAPIFGICVLSQNSMASAAFCETAMRFSWRAQYVLRWCYRMCGRRSVFTQTKKVCEFRGRRSVSLICRRCETKVNPLRRSCVSKRSRCGAVRICLELGAPSAEIVRVEALSLSCRANLSCSR